jgi:hypothetical protein
MINATDQKTVLTAVINNQTTSADFIYPLGVIFCRILGRALCRAFILRLRIFGR